jgi:DNA-binding GntR family transcriptional regulator
MGDDRHRAEPSGSRHESSLTNQVYRAIKEDILAARLGSEPIVEAVIAEQYGVSKTPVREALRQLAHEGLIVCLPRKGYLVRPMGVGDIVEVMTLRRIVEPALAAEAARNRTEEQVAQMEQVVSQEVSTSPSLESLRLSLRFHELIAEIAGNGRATAVVRALLDESARIPWLAPGLRIDPDVGEHSEIAAAIARGDADQAAEQMAAHLEAAITHTLQGLGAR